MRCPHCGNDTSKKGGECFHCGKSLYHIDKEQKNQYDLNYDNQQTINSNRYDKQNDDLDDDDLDDDDLDDDIELNEQPNEYYTGWWFLGFILPIVGFILYFVNKQENPQKSKSLISGAFWGVLLACFLSF